MQTKKDPPKEKAGEALLSYQSSNLQSYIIPLLPVLPILPAWMHFSNLAIEFDK